MPRVRAGFASRFVALLLAVLLASAGVMKCELSTSIRSARSVARS